MKHLLKEFEWLETQLGQYSAINLEFKTAFLGSSLQKLPHIGADSHAVSSKLVIVNQRAESRCLSSKAFEITNDYSTLSSRHSSYGLGGILQRCSETMP